MRRRLRDRRLRLATATQPGTCQLPYRAQGRAHVPAVAHTPAAIVLFSCFLSPSASHLHIPHLPPPPSMFHFERDSQPSTSISSQKPFASIAYSRDSVPQISTYPEPSASLILNFSNMHRAPLAPLDPQATHNLPNAVDNQMSIPSSSPHHGYAPFDTAHGRDRQHSGDLLRYNIGRPIIPVRAASDSTEGGLGSARRRSIPNQCVCDCPLLIVVLANLSSGIYQRYEHCAFLALKRSPSIPAP